MSAIQILVIESNPSLLSLLTQCLRSESEFELVGSALRVAPALALLARTRPEIVVMDVRVPETGLAQALGLFLKQSPQSKIILLADCDETRYGQSVARYGVTACLRKACIATQLIPLVKRVAREACLRRAQPALPLEPKSQSEIFCIAKELSVSHGLS